MLAQVIHIQPLTTIRRERRLPVPGKVVVRKGQKVGAADVVAEAVYSPQHMIVDVARGLGVPENRIDRYLQCKIGMRVSHGDLLAGPVGFAKRVVRAPKNGRVVLIVGGQIFLEVDSPPYELKAGIPGTVVALLEERGAIIETTGSVVQGVWGNGRIDFGLMNVLLKSPEDELLPDLDVSMRGSIVLGGFCRKAEVLHVAAGLPLRGLILSSMDAALVPLASQLKFPVIVVEGLGQIPLNSIAYKLLSTNERREVAINAEAWNRSEGQRPEIVIPLPASGEVTLSQEAAIFTTGQRVRVVSSPYQGEIGTITGTPVRAAKLPSGIQSASAEVTLERGESVMLPLANLEVIQ